MKNTRTFVVGMLVLPIAVAAIAVVTAGTASVPNNFVGGTPAIAAQVNANFQALVAEINANAPKYTVLEYGGEISDATVNFTYEQLRVVGNFTKQAADTDIILTWNSHVRVEGVADDFGDFQLRIDGNAAPSGIFANGLGRAVVYINGPTGDRQVNSHVRFTGLPAGVRQVEIWIRGDIGITVTENLGNFPRSVLVEEVFSN